MINIIDLGTLKITIDTNVEDTKKELSKLGDTVDKEDKKMNKSLSNIAKGVIAAFSVKAIVGFGKKVVEASADLQAMEAQFNQVFKGEENTQALDRIGSQVEDLGIHTDRLTDSWNKFGGQVKGAGMESEQALEAVDKATRLAADAAAFFDRSLEDTTGSLASFMKGNFAAGDAIGVFTNAKQMDTKANEMYDKSWADLTESERQWLLLDTVEKTYEMSGAMGQASREAGEYENVMGNLKATFERAYATIGEPILEIFLEVVQKVTKWVEDNTPTIEIVFRKVFEGIGWVWETVLYPVLSRLFDILKALYDWIKPYLPAIQKIVETVFGGIGRAVETVVGIFNGLINIIKTAVDWLDRWNNKEVQQKRVNATADPRYDGSHADGLDYVPFDGYRAILHQGERVVTAAENKSGTWGDNVNNNSVTITGNSFVIREEADIQKISRELQRQISMKQRGTVMA